MSAILRNAAPLAAGLVLAFNALAQEPAHHHGAAQTPPSPQVPTASEPRVQEDQAPAKPESAPEDHVGMGHGTQPSTAVDHAAMGHTQSPPAQVDHAAMGHTQSPPAQVDHAAMGHTQSPPAQVDHAAMGHTPPAAGQVDHAEMGRGPKTPSVVTPVPPPTDAERAAAVRPVGGHSMGDNARNWKVLVDRLEAFEIDGEHGLEWEAEAWAGTDIHKFWLRSEGERVGDDVEDADVELLYGRSVARWWDVVAGVRHHFDPGQAQDMAVLGVKGMAPYKVEVEASVYVGDSGYTGARVELEYEALLTSRLILQPTLEVNLHGQDERAHGNGAGLGMVEAGLRLRYEVSRHFAPYVGFVHQRAYGRTADFRREEGQDADDTRLVAGVRVWF